jgi:hypothetical protein
LDSGAYDFKGKRKGNECTKEEFISFEPIPGKNFSAIASGATPIGSAERAPDEVIAKLFRVEA